MAAPMTLTAVNLLDPPAFTRLFGNVVEHAPSIAAALARRRPFRDVEHLVAELNSIIDSLQSADKVDLLRRHPDLAEGPGALTAALTAESAREQAAAGLHHTTEQQKYDLRRLNQSYRDKFGFPFVICARENKTVAIMDGLRRRVLNTPERELQSGMSEVKNIARLRVLDLVISC